MEGICWEYSILGLRLVFLDAPLRRKSWGKGRDVKEARSVLRPQRPKPQSPLTSHPSLCQPLDSFPGALALPVQTPHRCFLLHCSPWVCSLLLILQGLTEPQPPTFTTCQS